LAKGNFLREKQMLERPKSFKRILTHRFFLWVFFGLGLRLDSVFACAFCRPVVNTQVYNQRFLPNLIIMIFPLLFICLICAIVHFWANLVSIVRVAKGGWKWKTN